MHRESTVLFAAELPAPLVDHLRRRLGELPGVRALFAESLDEAHLLELTPQAEMVVAWRLPPAVVEAAQRLRLWHFPGAGVQHLIGPFRELAQRGVVLCNGHGNAPAVAQHALALLLALSNRVVPYHNWMAQGRWRVADSAGGESRLLRGLTVGLLGYGAINRRLHRLLAGFELRFAACRRVWDQPAEESPTALQRFTPEQLDGFLQTSDILCIAVPQTSHTEGLIGARELELLGPGGLLLNVSRGSVAPEQPLFEALRAGVIAGAALDVWYDYRPLADAEGRQWPWHYPFHELPNVVLSPHRAASPVYDPQRWEEVVEQVRRFAAGEPPLNVVDLDAEY
jgi:phosphoglycerate dehydrogenase-like enzyme